MPDESKPERREPTVWTVDSPSTWHSNATTDEVPPDSVVSADAYAALELENTRLERFYKNEVEQRDRLESEKQALTADRDALRAQLANALADWREVQEIAKDALDSEDFQPCFSEYHHMVGPALRGCFERILDAATRAARMEAALTGAGEERGGG